MFRNVAKLLFSIWFFNIETTVYLLFKNWSLKFTIKSIVTMSVISFSLWSILDNLLSLKHAILREIFMANFYWNWLKKVKFQVFMVKLRCKIEGFSIFQSKFHQSQLNRSKILVWRTRQEKKFLWQFIIRFIRLFSINFYWILWDWYIDMNFFLH